MGTIHDHHVDKTNLEESFKVECVKCVNQDIKKIYLLNYRCAQQKMESNEPEEASLLPPVQTCQETRNTGISYLSQLHRGQKDF